MACMCITIPLLSMERQMPLKARLKRASTASESSRASESSSSEDKPKYDTPVKMVTPEVKSSPAVMPIKQKFILDLLALGGNRQALVSKIAQMGVLLSEQARADVFQKFTGDLNHLAKRRKLITTSLADLTKQQVHEENRIRTLKNEYEQLEAAIALLKTEFLPASLESEGKKALNEEIERLQKEKAELQEMVTQLKEAGSAQALRSTEREKIVAALELVNADLTQKFTNQVSQKGQK